HRVSFNSNGSISGNNMFDTLSFSPGNFYNLAAGNTQTINHEVFPTGFCDGPILIQSATNGIQARFEKESDTLLVNNTSLRDISTTGDAVFIAENSVDLGNNSGWDTILVSAPGKLFWVAGTGDWSDMEHWSLISGGIGGQCIPTPFDTVIFDQNSYSSIDQFTIVDLNNAFAHDMDWTGANYIPEFSGSHNSAYLRIYGSLKLNPIMDFTFPGYIYFGSTDSSETIITENIKFHNSNNNVYFDGIGGEWTLMDTLDLGYDLADRNTINFYQGNLITNDKFVKCYSFLSTNSNNRSLSPGSSDIHILNIWNVYGNNFTLFENNSFIRIDSGNFYHRYGNYFPYNDLWLASQNKYQKVSTLSSDSIIFKNVIFNNTGEMSGTNGSVYADYVSFSGEGKINTQFSGNVNVYVIDSLLFNSTGFVYGNDTVRNFVRFDSIGNIEGNGEYKNAMFYNDGNIIQNNLFDTLTFSPGYTYQLGGENTQTVDDQFNIVGNNCEDIILESTTDSLAKVFKESGSVFGEFIEMTNIKAFGDAIFDAGNFSTNVNNSNEGWIFHDSPLNYSLGNDTSFLEGTTLVLCAQYFNGNAETTYEWTNCSTGEVFGTDSCVSITEMGSYCLTVYYDEGPGCIKSDDIVVGCFLDLSFDTTHVSCNGFNDGAIEMQIVVGAEPYDISWFDENGQLISTSQNVYDLSVGSYYYTIMDAEFCTSDDTISLTEPDELEMGYISTETCYGENNGTIEVLITGGTEPYLYTWSNDSTDLMLTGLEPGEYSISITDDNNCPPVNETITINQLDELVFDLQGTDLICYQDSSGFMEILNLTGGTGNYIEYSWYVDDVFYSNDQNLYNVQSGEYTLTITDDYGCNASDSVTLTEPEEIILELVGYNGEVYLGSIDLTVTGGVAPYEYLWNTGVTTEDIDPLGGGNYVVEVTDNNLCKATDSLFVEVHYRVYAPTAFSPNGDNINDEFEIFGLGTDLLEFDLTVFNRYGQIVFQADNVNHHWNGRLNNVGEPLPMEVYTWQISLSYWGGSQVIDSG
ncbi:MAG: gliding motility-associated C-terminal domain-containing protein, partial [Bacteroidales bacterium]|nr:gliding motility-associated C-terminal domain-containing protein [Bacteroidales bacterium]